MAENLENIAEVVKAAFSIRAVSQFTILSKNETQAYNYRHYLPRLLRGYNVALFESIPRDSSENHSYSIVIKPGRRQNA